ncbi:MAG: IclR family transcriptional regulator [Firmicutes bacterium]|nr:IclR family transcriptional regulator [Bacillota bacterium]
MAQGGILVLDKALRLLTELAPVEGMRAHGVVELAGKTGMPVATTHRLLQVLKNHGFVSQTADKRYRIGLRVLELGMMVWRALDVRAIARPYMESLAKELEESIYLTLLDGLDGVHVEKVESPLNLRITEPIGMRLPLYRGASRLAMLAFHEPQLVIDVVSRGVANRDNVSLETIQTVLEQVRKTGFALTVGEVTKGTAGVAVPIRGYWGRPLASLSAAGPDWRYPHERVVQIADRLKQVVALIQEEMGVPHPSNIGESTDAYV